jgi:hypothetical protein
VGKAKELESQDWGSILSPEVNVSSSFFPVDQTSQKIYKPSESERQGHLELQN